MEIEEPLINELLLVGAALGSTETFTAEDGSLVERFIRGENCLEWLQDLQRALRRDDEATRAVSIRLGNWRVVETKLLPLLLECRDDLELVVTLAKIFVMLTMPLSPTARKWARFQVDARDAAELGGTEAARRRGAARAQVKHLLAMKRAFVQVAGGEAIAALVGAMEEPLARGARRSEADTLIIELVLTLFRNLLCIEDVCRGLAAAGGEEGPPGGAGDGVDDRLLHQELLVLLEREYVLEVVLCLCQGVQARENQPWNLLLMEIVFHLLRGHDAADVAAAGPPPPREGEEDGNGDENENEDPAARVLDLPLTTPAPPGKARGGGGGNALSALLQQERLARAAVAQKTASRHSRFGGGLLLAGFDGKATRLVTNPFKDALSSLPQARRKRTRRGNAVFASDVLMGAAGGGAHELEDGRGLGGAGGLLLLPKGAPDPLTLRARKALHGFCRQLVEGGGYEPFMKSLKNEFRRDSSRLEAGDRIVFFRIVGFVLAFHRFLCLHAAAAPAGAPRPDWAGALIHSMDVLSFNLVLSTIDNLVAGKGFADLVHAVALYKEMVGLLATLAGSPNEAYRNIAVGLQHRLFYASEPVDKLHKVGACWKPGLFPRRFLVDVLGLCEAQMRLLEGNAAKAQDEEALKKEGNAVIRDMLAARKRFDLDRYFASLCTNQMVRMATHLLEQYLTNPPYVTLEVLTFFQRMRDFDLERRQRHRGRKGDSPEAEEEEAGREKQTLEPMLFNVHTLSVLQTVLDDKRIAHEPRFADLLAFAKSVVRHFGRMATRNPLLLVEALFQHPFPHTFCSTLQQGYCQAHTIESVAVAAKGLGGADAADEEAGKGKSKGSKGQAKAGKAGKATKKKRDDFIVDDSEEDEDADYEGESESDEGGAGAGSGGSSEEEEEDAEEAGAAAAAQGIDPATYAAQKQSQRLRRKQQKREEARRRAAEEERRRLAALEEDSEDEWDGMLPAAPDSGASSAGSSDSDSDGGKKKRKDKAAKAPGGGVRRRGAARWDIKEDATLRREYPKYKDSASCFFVLAGMGPLGEKGRTAEQVKRRLRFLKLLDPSAGAGAGTGKKPGKEKKKKGSGSDSSSSSPSSSSSSDSEGGKSRVSRSSSKAASSPSKSPAASSSSPAGKDGEEGEATQKQQQEGAAATGASGPSPGAAAAGGGGGRRRIRKKAVESSSESSDDAELDILS